MFPIKFLSVLSEANFLLPSTIILGEINFEQGYTSPFGSIKNLRDPAEHFQPLNECCFFAIISKKFIFL